MALVLALPPTLTAWAQQPGSPDMVMQRDQVTESALIEALSLELPEKTRGFRPMTRPSVGIASAPKGRANLLMTFATGSAELNGETREMLDVVARALQSDTLATGIFTIEGHADQRGDPDANRTLSQARADAVIAYLVQHHSIARERLSAVGKGANEPLNRDRMDAPENRRVTIVTRRP